MFDIRLRSLKDGLFNPLCQFIPSSISPGLITFLAFLSGLLSIYLASQRSILPSLLFWFLNRSLDCLDGALARHRNIASDLGGFLDLLADFWIYSLLPIGIAVGWDVSSSCLLSVAFLEATFHVNNFILFYVAAIAEKKANDQPARARTKELTSVMMRPAFVEGMESGVLFTLMLAFPNYIGMWCGLMAAAVGVGIGQRTYWVVNALRFPTPIKN
ncbi:MAG: hypothetical protein OHK93_005791 [Ramalina farinacea]|uniref:CDP-alcohol phosphatidyltransferase n=1 Tax=Ramalina farinacea TaxID=258253 RepID=A0AA43QLL6_9LECA|nr:hypothetical protein [Ramalina farinacea]